MEDQENPVAGIAQVGFAVYTGNIAAGARAILSNKNVIIAIAILFAIAQMIFMGYLGIFVLGILEAVIIAASIIPIAILSPLTEVLDFLYNKLGKPFVLLLKTLHGLEYFNKAIENVVSIFQGAWSELDDVFKDVIDKLKKAGKAVVDWVTHPHRWANDITVLEKEGIAEGENFNLLMQDYTILGKALNEFVNSKEDIFDCLTLFDIMCIKNKESYVIFNSNSWDIKIKSIKDACKNKTIEAFLADSIDKDKVTNLENVKNDFTIKKFIYVDSLASFFNKSKDGEYSFTSNFPIMSGYNYLFPLETDFKGFNEYMFNFKEWGYRIFTDKDTPIVAPENAIIEKIGWNEDHGFTICLKSEDGNRYYEFSSMTKYADTFKKYETCQLTDVTKNNLIVKKGEIIGFAGCTGGNEIGCENGNRPSVLVKIYFKVQIPSKEANTEYTLVPVDGYLILKLLENNKMELTNNASFEMRRAS